MIREDQNGDITAVHDCSSGGFGIAISEMAISGNLGAIIDVNKVPVKVIRICPPFYFQNLMAGI